MYASLKRAADQEHEAVLGHLVGTEVAGHAADRLAGQRRLKIEGCELITALQAAAAPGSGAVRYFA